MVGYLRYLVAAALVSNTAFAAVGEHLQQFYGVESIIWRSPPAPVPALAPGCVTINGVQFCSKAKEALTIGPDGCVSINGVSFCSQPQRRAGKSASNPFLF